MEQNLLLEVLRLFLFIFLVSTLDLFVHCPLHLFFLNVRLCFGVTYCSCKHKLKILKYEIQEKVDNVLSLRRFLVLFSLLPGKLITVYLNL